MVHPTPELYCLLHRKLAFPVCEEIFFTCSALHTSGNKSFVDLFKRPPALVSPLRPGQQRMVQDPLTIKIRDAESLHGAHVRIGLDRNWNHLAFEPMGRETMA